jgi:ferritin-like metal-binding protein YciE
VSIKNLEDLFVDKLKDIYDAERRITKALPKMAKSATSEELRSAFEEHLRQTEGQIERLDQIFEDLGMTPGRKPCHGMMGLLEEGRELMEEEAPSSVMDAGLISSAQEVEHYEIGSYGTLKAWADLLGKKTEAKLLQQTLEEEEAADEKLTAIAGTINAQALDGEDEDEGMVAVGRTKSGASGSKKSRSR